MINWIGSAGVNQGSCRSSSGELKVTLKTAVMSVGRYVPITFSSVVVDWLTRWRLRVEAFDCRLEVPVSIPN